jgi:DNA-binding winged helix-turn-helix (wHTH) protein
MTNQPPGRCYLFDEFRVDPDERVLLKGDREIPLTPKVFDTLLALIENSSHVLTKKELMQKVWPDSFVEENNLAQNISILRKALGGEYIKTIPKRGYRFVADVTSPEEERVIIHERTRTRIVVEQDEDPVITHPNVIDVTPVETLLLRAPETMYARSGDVNIA